MSPRPFFVRCTIRAVIALMLAAPATVLAQQLWPDTSFGVNGRTVLQAPSGWWTDWNERNAHIVNQGGAFTNTWTVAFSVRTILGSNLFYERRYGVFTDGHASASIFDRGWGAGPPLTTGGIVPSGSTITFVGTGNPGGTVESVHIARTDVDPFANPATSCSGGFQTHLLYGPTATEDVRGVTPLEAGRFLVVGATRLADGQSRGLIAALNFDCSPVSSFGTGGGALLLDVNPFVIGPPPRRVRVNAARTFTNAAGQPRIVIAGGVRYGLATTSPGACFLAVLTPSGALDPSFDGDGIRLFDAAAVLNPGPTYCDFHAVAPIADASGRGFVTIADWRRDSGVEAGVQLLRFTESGTPTPGFNATNVPRGNEIGPSVLAVREDGFIVVGWNYLALYEGMTVASHIIFLANPATGDGVTGSSNSLGTGFNSAVVSAIVPASNNRVYAIGTAGSGRFGHDRLIVRRFSDGNRTVAVEVPGGGTVSSSPAGISNCGAPGGVCTRGFPPGSTVTLTATPQPAHRFLRWELGFAACGANPVCTFTVSTDVTGRALFQATTEVTIARTGQGGITSDPAGLSCGTTPGSGCGGIFDRNPLIPVRFTATPSGGWRFVEWTGAFASCGTGPVCDRFMDAPTLSATATFAPLADPIFANGFEP
jgi:hypothetical protein